MTVGMSTGSAAAKHQYNVHEAKTHLSRLLEEVKAGVEVTISKAGEPVAKIVPIRSEIPRRTPGLLRGQITMADDWDSDATNQEIARDFDMLP